MKDLSTFARRILTSTKNNKLSLFVGRKVLSFDQINSFKASFDQLKNNKENIFSIMETEKSGDDLEKSKKTNVVITKQGSFRDLSSSINSNAFIKSGECNECESFLNAIHAIESNYSSFTRFYNCSFMYSLKGGLKKIRIPYNSFLLVIDGELNFNNEENKSEKFNHKLRSGDCSFFPEGSVANFYVPSERSLYALIEFKAQNISGVLFDFLRFQNPEVYSKQFGDYILYSDSAKINKLKMIHLFKKLKKYFKKIESDEVCKLLQISGFYADNALKSESYKDFAYSTIRIKHYFTDCETLRFSKPAVITGMFLKSKDSSIICINGLSFKIKGDVSETIVTALRSESTFCCEVLFAKIHANEQQKTELRCMFLDLIRSNIVSHNNIIQNTLAS